MDMIKTGIFVPVYSLLLVLLECIIIIIIGSGPDPPSACFILKELNAAVCEGLVRETTIKLTTPQLV